MLEHHRALGRALLTKVQQRLNGDDLNGVAALDPATLSAADVARLAKVGVEVEREALGLSAAATAAVGRHREPVPVAGGTVIVADGTEEEYITAMRRARGEND